MPEVSEEYEIMNIPPSRYLCTVPVLAPPPAPNQTATELAKAEEARELARAKARGWELMSGLDHQCLYYISGWWSYKFCYGQNVVQFHALPSGVKGGLPTRDPNSQEYTLGRVEDLVEPGKKKGGKKQHENTVLQKEVNGQQHPVDGLPSPAPPNTELQVKGDQRFLVQRMEGGTICDLTGRERTIEIQYHCNPGSVADRIGWIKEITTCSYLMLVHTPRLCEDIAFLPPKETRAHPISCQLIVESEEELAALRFGQSIEASEAAQGIGQGQDESEGAEKAAQQQENKGNSKFGGMEIGGVVIGGKQLHNSEDGQPPPKLKPPRGFVPSKGTAAGSIETLAKALSKADGGKVEKMSDEDLEKLNLNPDAVEQFRQELEKIAGEKGWTLEVIETPGGAPEIVGIVEEDQYDDDQEGNGLGEEEEESGSNQEGEGSEEKFFKEEL